MTNFDKLKEQITVEQVAEHITAFCDGCDYCAYDRKKCAGDCEYGITKFLKRKVDNNA